MVGTSEHALQKTKTARVVINEQLQSEPDDYDCSLDGSFYKLTADNRVWLWDPEFEEWYRSTKPASTIEKEIEAMRITSQRQSRLRS